MQGQEELLKSIETGDFINGQGLLNREQQRQYVLLLKRYSSLIQNARSVLMPQSAMEINKLHVGEVITVAVSENTNPAQDNKFQITTVNLDAKKVRSRHDLTTEMLQQNLEGSNLELTIMQAMAARHALDLEYLALLGDESLSPVAGDKLGNLLVSNDGWFKQAQSGHIVDADGAQLEPGLFSEMIRRLPPQYRGDPGLRFIVGETALLDWMDHIQARPTDLGDRQLGSGAPVIGPYGKRLLVAPLIPDDLVLPVTESIPATVKSFLFGPYVMANGINDELRLNINSGGNFDVDFGDGTKQTQDVVKIFNDAFVANSAPCIAFDDGYGQIVLRTTTLGAASTIEVVDQAGNPDARDTLGFSVGTTTGGSSGDVREGTFVMLTNPRNLIWGILDGTRMFTEYNKDFDRIENVTYNQVDSQIENLDALVLATNVRRKRTLESAIP